MAPVLSDCTVGELALVCSGVTGLPVPDDCHPAIRAIYQYWRSIHPGTGLPGRQHVDPVDIPHLLSNLWLLDVVRSPVRFRMRLVGTRVVAYAGKDNTGKWIDEKWPDYNDAIYRRIVETGQPSWWRGPSQFRPDKTYFELERVRLPLARDGETVDMILCLTMFYDRAGQEILTTM
jgi:hypothetical protein